MKSILILIPFFGSWPEWFPLYLESCRANPTVHWKFYTDCPVPGNRPPNVAFECLSFEDYCARVSTKLELDFSPPDPYKLCDLKPLLGEIHGEDIKGYDYFGFGDIDLVYGSIRRFYDDQVLSHLCVCTHWDRVSGHLTLLRNLPEVRSAFRHISDWKSMLADPRYRSIDESKFSKVFLRHKKHPQWLRRLYGLFNPLQGRGYFKEQYTTVLFPKPWWDGSMEHPEVWFWKDGRLTNERDGEREFLYLHFMNWKSTAWLPEFRGKQAAWQNLDRLNYVPPGAEGRGFRIDRAGFHPLV